MWSFACLVFELATGDLLFDPRAGKDYERDDDHLALVSELCGRVPKRVWSAGKRGKDFFTRTGELRRIRKLRFWPLDAVLREKYGFSREEVSWLFAVCFGSPSREERTEKKKHEARKSPCHDDRKERIQLLMHVILSTPLRSGRFLSLFTRERALEKLGGMSQKRKTEQRGKSVFLWFIDNDDRNEKKKKKLTSEPPPPPPKK